MNGQPAANSSPLAGAAAPKETQLDSLSSSSSSSLPKGSDRGSSVGGKHSAAPLDSAASGSEVLSTAMQRLALSRQTSIVVGEPGAIPTPVQSTPGSTKRDKVDPANIRNDCKLFVGGLSWETTDEGLQQYFARFGEIREAMVMRDPISNRSRGFAFVTFNDLESVHKVLSHPTPHVIDRKQVDPKKAVPRSEQPGPPRRPPFTASGMEPASYPRPLSSVGPIPPPATHSGNAANRKIFIGGLNGEMSKDALTFYFSQFGEVEDLVIIIDQNTGKYRGFGFATFRDIASAIKAVNQDRHVVEERPIEVKFATPKFRPSPVESPLSQTRRFRPPGPSFGAGLGSTSPTLGGISGDFFEGSSFAAYSYPNTGYYPYAGPHQWSSAMPPGFVGSPAGTHRYPIPAYYGRPPNSQGFYAIPFPPHSHPADSQMGMGADSSSDESLVPRSTMRQGQAPAVYTQFPHHSLLSSVPSDFTGEAMTSPPPVFL